MIQIQHIAHGSKITTFHIGNNAVWGQLYDGNFNHTVSSFGIEPRGFKVDYCKIS